MQLRTAVVVSSAAGKAKKLNTSATNWGQLRSQIASELGFPVDNVSAVMEPGKVTLSQDDSELFSGDIRIFLVPTKNKAGISDSEAEAVGHRIGEAIKRASAMAGKKVEDLEDQLIQAIEEFYDVDLEMPPSGSSREEQALLERSREYEG